MVYQKYKKYIYCIHLFMSLFIIHSITKYYWQILTKLLAKMFKKTFIIIFPLEEPVVCCTITMETFITNQNHCQI